MDRSSELVEAFADSSRRFQASVELVGPINANDLRRVHVDPAAKATLIEHYKGKEGRFRRTLLGLVCCLACRAWMPPNP